MAADEESNEEDGAAVHGEEMKIVEKELASAKEAVTTINKAAAPIKAPVQKPKPVEPIMIADDFVE